MILESPDGRPIDVEIPHSIEDLDKSVKSLLQSSSFTTHAKIESNWKIECDVLTDEDWMVLARLGKTLIGDFGIVEGIPRGGIKFANELDKLKNQNSKTILIVDDVCTTGKSLIDFSERFNHQPLALVAFNRGRFNPWWLNSIFQSNVTVNLI